MEYICKYHKFGYCKMKDQCEKYHVNEECKEGSDCKNLTTCPLRHPKMCKRIVLEEHCVFREKCAYNHKRKTNSQIKEINTLHEIFLIYSPLRKLLHWTVISKLNILCYCRYPGFIIGLLGPGLASEIYFN